MTIKELWEMGVRGKAARIDETGHFVAPGEDRTACSFLVLSDAVTDLLC